MNSPFNFVSHRQLASRENLSVKLDVEKGNAFVFTINSANLVALYSCNGVYSSTLR
jgi:hypothetical protein